MFSCCANALLPKTVVHHFTAGSVWGCSSAFIFVQTAVNICICKILQEDKIKYIIFCFVYRKLETNRKDDLKRMIGVNDTNVPVMINIFWAQSCKYGTSQDDWYNNSVNWKNKYEMSRGDSAQKCSSDCSWVMRHTWWSGRLWHDTVIIMMSVI